MPDDIKSQAAPVAPALPASVTLNADYVWFTPATKNSSSFMVQRSKGDVITDADEIAYLLGRNADVTTN